MGRCESSCTKSSWAEVTHARASKEARVGKARAKVEKVKVAEEIGPEGLEVVYLIEVNLERVEEIAMIVAVLEKVEIRVKEKGVLLIENKVVLEIGVRLIVSLEAARSVIPLARNQRTY